MLPPFDAHAHTSSARALRDAVILGVTGSGAEFDRIRADATVILGIGCHPADPAAVGTFDARAFAQRLTTTPLIGEVGLDGRSAAPKNVQRRVCRQILQIAQERSCFVSLHSVGAQGPLLDALSETPITGAILHWWTGSDAQTREAVLLGCWFSVGPGMLRRKNLLTRLPRSRVLTETDAPFGVPVAGRIEDVEGVLASLWECDVEEVRRQTWRNFAAIVEATQTGEKLSPLVRGLLRDAPLDRAPMGEQ